ncbi:MAG: hypothetical protein SOZ62_07275 [Eubacteriales bacterium]|nr:hypothetical protein [Eubacteriales bacterium]
MGFGTLFVGYIIGINFVSKQGIFWFISSLIMLFALTKLYEYNKWFRYSLVTCAVMSVLSMAAAVFEVLAIFGREYTTVIMWFVTVQPMFTAVFTYFLLSGIIDIAKETGAANIFQRAFVQRFFLFVFYIPFIFMNFSNDFLTPSQTAAKVVTVIYIIMCVFGVIYIAINAKLIFSCYMWIYIPEDENTEETVAHPEKDKTSVTSKRNNIRKELKNKKGDGKK